MKEGDLVQVSYPDGANDVRYTPPSSSWGKFGVLVEPVDLHHGTVMIWRVMIDGEIMTYRGRDLRVVDETG